MKNPDRNHIKHLCRDLKVSVSSLREPERFPEKNNRKSPKRNLRRLQAATAAQVASTLGQVSAYEKVRDSENCWTSWIHPAIWWVKITWRDCSSVTARVLSQIQKVKTSGVFPSAFWRSHDVFCDVVVMGTALRENTLAARPVLTVRLCSVCCCWHLVVIHEVSRIKVNGINTTDNKTFDLKVSSWKTMDIKQVKREKHIKTLKNKIYVKRLKKYNEIMYLWSWWGEGTPKTIIPCEEDIFVLILDYRIFVSMSQSEGNNLISVDFEIFGHVQGLSFKLFFTLLLCSEALRLEYDLTLNLEKSCSQSFCSL